MQIQVGIAAAAANIVVHVVAGEVVVQQPGVNSVIPELRGNIAARAVAHKGLGNGQVQALLADVEAAGGLFDHGGQRYAGIGGQRIHSRHGGSIDAHTRQLSAGQTGRQPMILFPGLKGHVAGGHKAVVQVDIDPIGAGRYLLSLFETGEVRHRRRIVSQKTRVKIEFRPRGKGLRGKRKQQRELHQPSCKKRGMTPGARRNQTVRSIFQM